LLMNDIDVDVKMYDFWMWCSVFFINTTTWFTFLLL